MIDLTVFRTLHVTADADGHVLVVELDHGRANEMGTAQLDEWAALTALCHDHDEVRAVVTWSHRISTRGTPIFISGADVTERSGWTPERVRAHVRHQRDVLAALRRAPVFHVAVVNGVALGWGTEFMLACDYRIATPRATFALPETSIGIVPGAGGTSELWSVVGVNQALRLGMTGERIDAAEALRIGLVDELQPDNTTGMERALALAERVVRRSPTAVAAFKQGVLASVGADPTPRQEIEARAYDHCTEGPDVGIGRENFKAIVAGEEVAWGPRRRFDP